MAKSQINRIFERDPLAFLKKCAVSPGDFTSASSAQLSKVGGLYDAKPHTQTGGAAIDATLTVQTRLKKLAYTSLEEISDPQTNRIEHNSYKLMFRTPVEIGTAAADYIPCYFLPWASNHLTKMQLNPKLPASKLDPDLFFTAAINGCSVMVTGDSKAPIITHGGTSDSRSIPSNDNAFAGGNARQHWKGLFQNDLAANNINTPIFGIHKDDYINYAFTGTTPEAATYQSFLNSNGSRHMRIDSVTAEGAVFGLRDAGGDWAFYLQKKVRFIFTRLRKAGISKYEPVEISTGRQITRNIPGSTQKKTTAEVITDTRTVNVTISVVKFYPGNGVGAPGSVMLPPNQVKAMLDSYNT